jgi:DHA1 family bicyclomycin/chloramphenicol resistance-like MFS transporter
MSHVSLVFAVAPAIAPLAGGWVLGWGSWRTIFWALTGYGALLLALAGVLLPETHPRERRAPFRPGPLLESLVATARHGGVQRLSGAITCNFAGLFLYISSAPAIINDHLHLGAQDFGVLFVPLVACMMIGSFLAGRLAGRRRAPVIVITGFAVSLAGAAFGVVNHLAGGTAALPWAIVPAAAAAFGVSLALPILTIELLDLRPEARGSVSSYQAFLTTIVNAAVAGVLSPLVSGSLLVLGVVAAGLTAAAVALWVWEFRRQGTRAQAASGARPPARPQGVPPLANDA